MNVLILTGSPHKNGVTALLADRFAAGACSAGHHVQFFHAASETVHPCVACDHCRTADGVCVFQDSMAALNDQLFAADLVAFVTPLHYFSFSAQLKTVISRFHANNARLKAQPKQAALLSACAISERWAMEPLSATYGAMLRYLNWTDAGQVLAVGCPSRSVAEKTEFPIMTYALGQSVGPLNFEGKGQL